MRSRAPGAAPAVEARPGAMRRADAFSRHLDRAGLAVLGAAVGWTYASSGAAGGDPRPVAALFLACGAAVVAGRFLGRASRTTASALVAGVVLVVAWWSLGGILELPRRDPLGYSNATAAFFVQATCAALLLAATTRNTAARTLGVLTALAFALLTLRTRSAAGTMLLALPVAALAVRSRQALRRVAVGAGGLVLLALAVAILLAAVEPALEGSGSVPNAVDATLSQLRPALWRDAVGLMAEHPVFGVGPGRFDLERRVAAGDPDARWAHNGFLQQGAEQGALGLAILVLLFLWGAARLQAAAGAGAATALAAASLTALGIHANVDYVLHFPAVPIAAAALLGIATAIPLGGAVEAGPDGSRGAGA